MKATDYVASVLEQAGVTHVFELSGGMIAHLLDSFSRNEAIRVVSVHHEQGGAFAAEGFGRFTGRPAVALGTSGPGALNLLPGIAGCYYDSVPALFITGQVQTYLQRRDRPIRQFGLQECDFTPVARPVAKAAFAVHSAAELPDVLAEALRLATTGRPGPVVIELPFDVQGAAVEAAPAAPEIPPPAAADTAEVEAALAALAKAARPLLLAGGGVRAAHAADACVAFARATGIPLAATVLALDLLADGDPLRVGMPGTYGTRAANLAVAESDAVLVLGSRLDQGITGADTAAWKRGKTIVHVDCDPGEQAARLRGTVAITADAGAFLAAAGRLVAARPLPDFAAWRQRVAALLAEHPDTAELEGCEGINPNAFLRDLSLGSPAARAFVVDAGQHTWWTAHSLRLRAGQRFLASTGLWAMGTALPAAIGAALACGGPVVVIAGDGGAQLNVQELQTVVRNRLPVKLVVIHNGCHGMVRQFQEENFGGRYPSTLWGYSAPDFTKVAGGWGIAGRTVEDPEGVEAAVRWLWEDEAAPRLLQVAVATFTNVYPHVPFGKPITAMASFHRPQ
jgi:acetolactate synthase I/II/III large subunit